jgi:hypothetical protein
MSVPKTKRCTVPECTAILAVANRYDTCTAHRHMAQRFGTTDEWVPGRWKVREDVVFDVDAEAAR